MQYTIDQHISNLLFYQECVVIPDFGAFLTRYFPAELNGATHMFRPPSRRVVFNEKIKDNDGLLAKHIAQVEQVSYEQSFQSIAISVRSWKKILGAGKKINLHGIGRLFLDEQNNLQFNPGHDVNYHAASYGLNIFRASAMEREQEIRRSVNRAIEGKLSKGSKAAAKKPGDGSHNPLPNASRKNWVRYVAVLGPVAALILVGSYLYTQEPQTYQNISGYVSDFFSPPSQIEKEEQQKKEEGESFILGTDSLNKEDDKPSADSDLAETTPRENQQEVTDEAVSSAPPVESAREERVKTEKSSPKPVQQRTSQAGFGIVVGSFSQASNAERYARQLSSQGFDSRTQSKGGMTRVLIGNYVDKGEAMYKLNQIKAEVNAQAWLYLP